MNQPCSSRLGRAPRLTAFLLAVLLLASAAAVAAYAALPPVESDLASALGLGESAYNRLVGELYNAARNGDDSVNIRSYNVPVSRFTALNNILMLNPEFYYTELKSYTATSTGLLNTVYFNTFLNASQREEVQAAADELLDGLEGSALTDVQKALILHDRLAITCRYDETLYTAGSVVPESYTLYGTMVRGVSVCQGYAEAYTYLMNRLGIPTIVCDSDEMSHAWNIVYLNGGKYYVDNTWDDPTGTPAGYAGHNYFLISVGTLRADGKHNAADYDATATSTDFDNAFWRDLTSPFILLDGKIYYVDSSSSTLNRWDGTTSSVLTSTSDVWRAGASSYYPGCYARLATDGSALYFNLSDRVCRYVPGSVRATVEYLAEIPAGTYRNIYGLEYADGSFRIDLSAAPVNAAVSRVTWTPGTRRISDIFVRTLPVLTEFAAGSEFTCEGLEVGVRYGDGSAGLLAGGYTVSAPSLTAAGIVTVTVTYAGFSTHYSVTVRDPSAVVSIRLHPNGGIGTTVTAASEPGTTYYYPDAVFRRTGYSFIGWSKTAERPDAFFGGTTYGTSYRGHSADLYAIWERNPSVVFGDVDGNGTVSGRDLVILRRYLADFDSSTGSSSLEVAEGSDANGDGSISVLDLALLRRYLADYDYVNGVSGIILGN